MTRFRPGIHVSCFVMGCALVLTAGASPAHAVQHGELGAVGIGQGQSVRVNASSIGGSLDSFVSFFDRDGGLIRSNRLFVPAGTIRSLTVNFTEIPTAPDASGRRTVRVQIFTVD